MLATHNPKHISSRTKNDAICSDIIGPINPKLICSKTTKMRKKYWSSPRNPSDLEEFMRFGLRHKHYLPKLEDNRWIKQVLLPIGQWQNNEYLSASPVESLGLLHEVHCRVYEQGLKHRNITLEGRKSMLKYHGELMIKQLGEQAMMVRGLTEQINIKERQKTSGLAITMMVHDCNINAGYVSVGHPAITAIGGFVHTIERAVGVDIEFAVGLQDIAFYRHLNPFITKKPVVRKDVKWGLGFEVKGDLAMTIILRTKNMNDLFAIYNHIDPNVEHSHFDMARIGGGTIIGYDVKFLSNELPPVAHYLMDVTYKNTPRMADSLQTGIDLYASYPFVHSVNQIGYAWLEKPMARELSRNGYNHVWAEPVFTTIEQTAFTGQCWWQRVSYDDGVLWQGKPSLDEEISLNEFSRVSKFSYNY